MTKTDNLNGIKGALYVKGEDLDPSVVAKTLGVMPKNASKRGDVIKTKSSLDILAKTGFYVLSSGPVDGDGLNDFIESLPLALSRVWEIEGVDEVYLDIRASIEGVSTELEMSFKLSEEALKRLHEGNMLVKISFLASFTS
jgi:hypothetical protein